MSGSKSRFGGVFLALLLSGLATAPALACTTILIGSGLTADGSILHAHNEDMGADAVGILWAAPPTRRDQRTLRVPYVEIASASERFAYWASGNAPDSEGLGVAAGGNYDDVLVGMNERGVSMSCNWAHSRESNLEGVGIRRYAIRQLLLERSTSARDGVELLGRLIETHGQADWGGLIYHLADDREAWVVETTTHHWVARRVRDDEIRVTANRFRIGTDYDLASHGLMEFATERGWHSAGTEFHFADAYGRPDKMDQPYDTRREERVETLLEEIAGSIRPESLFPILRDRYEETEFYTPPQTEPVWREDLDLRPDLSRTLSTHLAQSTFVAHGRSWRHDALGPVMWFGFATPSYAGYVPLYARPGAQPDELFGSAAEEPNDLPWQTFRQLQRAVDQDYSTRYPEVRAAWDSEHRAALATTREVERQALSLIEHGDRQGAERLLAELSRRRATADLERARSLLETLATSPVD